jgi:regulator of RNase E activity RraA
LENPDVFVIIVPNEEMQELALDAYDSMGIDRDIVVEVRAVDPWKESYSKKE